MAYYSLEPFGEERADLRMAIVASLIANANRDPKHEAYKPEDFMPFKAATESRMVSEQKAPGWQETKRRFMALVKR